MSTVNLMDLTGRHILVTGASIGIGRATAQVLAGLGARLTLNGRNAERLQATLATLPNDGHAAAPFDLTGLDQVPGWIKTLTAERGVLDGIAHCGGLQAMRPIRAFTAAFFDDMMRTNLGSTLALARGLRQKGCRGDGASLVVVSSAAGAKALPGNVVYAAAKAAVNAAVQGLAAELLADGIRVNAVAPALVDTELVERLRVTLTPDQFDRLLALQPLGLGRPEDVGQAIAFLIAATGRHITGTVLTIDGGASAR